MRIGFVYFHTSTFDPPDKLFEQLLPSFYSGACKYLSQILTKVLLDGSYVEDQPVQD
jgi:restriction endonuclease Mrr